MWVFEGPGFSQRGACKCPLLEPSVFSTLPFEGVCCHNDPAVVVVAGCLVVKVAMPKIFEY